MEELSPKVIETIRHAAKGLTGSKRREFEARVSLDYLGGDARLTETVFGWSRHTVARGIKERNSGQVIPAKSFPMRPVPSNQGPKTRIPNWLAIFSNWSSLILRRTPSSRGSSSTRDSPQKRCVKS